MRSRSNPQPAAQRHSAEAAASPLAYAAAGLVRPGYGFRPQYGGREAVSQERVIVVTGATGRQGGAVVRHLLQDGWHVRALTRKPASPKAQSLATHGAELVAGDMGNRASLVNAFHGAYGIYSVQNPMISGPEAEVRQGKLVADVAKEVGVQTLVYGSAGTGHTATRIGSWESKLQVEAHMRAIDLPVTVLRL